MSLARRVIVEEWNGEIDSLPESGPGMVWASSTLRCGRDELVAQCRKLDHFCFYYDDALSHPADTPEEAVTQWLYGLECMKSEGEAVEQRAFDARVAD